MRTTTLLLIIIVTVLFAWERQYFMYTGDVNNMTRLGSSYFFSTGDGIVETDTTFAIINHHIDFPGVEYPHPSMYQIVAYKDMLFSRMYNHCHIYDGEQWIELTDKGAPIEDMYNFFTLPSGKLLFERSGYICDYVHGKWIYRMIPGTEDTLKADFVLEDSKGRIIYLNERDSLIIRGDEIFTLPIKGKTIYTAAVDSEDNLLMQRYTRSIGSGPVPPLTSLHRYDWKEEWIDSAFMGVQTYDIIAYTTMEYTLLSDQKALFRKGDSLFVCKNNNIVDTIFTREQHLIEEIYKEGDAVFFNGYFPQNHSQHVGVWQYKDNEFTFIDTRTTATPYFFSALAFDKNNNPIIEGVNAGDTGTYQITDTGMFRIDSLFGLRSPFIHNWAKDKEHNYHMIVELSAENYTHWTYSGEKIQKSHTGETNRALPTAMKSTGELYAYRFDTCSNDAGKVLFKNKEGEISVQSPHTWQVPNLAVDNVVLQDDTILWIEPVRHNFIYGIHLNSGRIDSLQAAIPTNTENYEDAIMALDSTQTLWVKTPNYGIVTLKDGRVQSEDTLPKKISGIVDLAFSPKGHLTINNRSYTYFLQDDEWISCDTLGRSIPDFAFNAKGDLVVIFEDRTLITIPLDSGSTSTTSSTEIGSITCTVQSRGEMLQLTVHNPAGKVLNMGIKNLRGQELMHRQFDLTGSEIRQKSLPLTDLAQGIYIVQISLDGRELLHKKLVIGR